MTTMILAVIALSGPLAPAAKPEFSAQTDYGQAMKVAATEKKPMAVLIGKGDQFAKLMADTNLTTEAKKLLTEKYVCVTVDVTTDAGKSLASQFQMTDGLVISSAGGSHQAFRQAGTVTATDLSKQAATYATVAGTPTTTITAGTPVQTTTSYYPSTSAPVAPATPTYYYPSYSSCPGGNCPNVIPAGFSTPYSSCPNGRCPTR